MSKDKKPVNGKKKGNGFERKVAKMLSDWSGHPFHRTPMSGALHWSNDKRVVSDIVPPQELKWPFSVECKNVESSWEFNTLLESTCLFWKHWTQAQEDAIRENMVPILVFTKNYRNVFIALENHSFEQLLELSQGDCNFFTKEYLKISNPAFGNLVILPFDSFLDTFSLDIVKKFYDKNLV